MRIISQTIALVLITISLIMFVCAEDEQPVTATPIELTFPSEDPTVVTEIHNFFFQKLELI